MTPAPRTIRVPIACASAVVYDFLAHRQQRLACAPFATESPTPTSVEEGEMLLAWRADGRAASQEASRLRVVHKSDGAEVVCTLVASENMSPALFAANAAVVEGELMSLKRLLEVDADHAE